MSQAVLQRKPQYQFSSDATYVIAGGFGGVGRSIARWMYQRGAQNLVLLSRSGPSSPAAKDLVDELEAKGACLYTPRCDISDATAVKSIFKHVESTMPPIRGCVQASMVLQVSRAKLRI